MRITVPWDNDVLTVRQLLNYTADKYGDAPCIRYEDENGETVTKTYRELRSDSLGVAAFLKSESPRSRHIALAAKTSYPFLTAMNGIMAGGDVAVPMSPETTAPHLAKILADCDAEAVFCDESTEDTVIKAAKALPAEIRVFKLGDSAFAGGVFNAENDFSSLPAENPDDDTVIIYTSGTTGEMKGACLSSRAIISNIWFKEMSFEGGNVALNVLPMHHIFCFSCDYLKNLKDGVLICLNGDLINLGRNLLKYEPSVVRMVPAMAGGLAKKVAAARKRNPALTPRQAAEKVFGGNITNIIVSGAAFNPAIAEPFEEMGIEVRQGYGMTETGPRIAVPDGKTCASSGGRVISLCEVRIAEDGEIQVKSPSLMSRYYKKPAETEAVFTADGWFRTGDIGYLTDDRELFITGRIKNLIILSNGENVSPEGIEKEIAENPLVSEILVYGKESCLCADIYPDYAYAQANGIEDIKAAAGEIIEAYNSGADSERRIFAFSISAEPLPKTATGKVKRS